MNTSELSLVPLQHASLCMDCEMITASQAHCVACGSAALMSLARALNGKARSKPVRRNAVAIRENLPPRQSQPIAFNGSYHRQRQRFRGKYADLRKAFVSVLFRPVSDVFAIRYGS